jgi:hypothetical protein
MHKQKNKNLNAKIKYFGPKKMSKKSIIKPHMKFGEGGQKERHYRTAGSVGLDFQLAR